MRKDLIYPDECYKLVGACFEVYKEKGAGFAEMLYHECLELEFKLQGIIAVHEPQLELAYKGHKLRQKFIPDFICYGKIVIEIKAQDHLTNVHRAQLQNYLRATGHKLGILANFGHTPGLEWERIVLSEPKTQSQNPPALQ